VPGAYFKLWRKENKEVTSDDIVEGIRKEMRKEEKSI
jgi:hypothetical protein